MIVLKISTLFKELELAKKDAVNISILYKILLDNYPAKSAVFLVGIIRF